MNEWTKKCDFLTVCQLFCDVQISTFIRWYPSSAFFSHSFMKSGTLSSMNRNLVHVCDFLQAAFFFNSFTHQIDEVLQMQTGTGPGLSGLSASLWSHHKVPPQNSSRSVIGSGEVRTISCFDPYTPCSTFMPASVHFGEADMNTLQADTRFENSWAPHHCSQPPL